VCVCVCVCVHVCVCVCVCITIHIYILRPNQSTHICMYVCMYTYICKQPLDRIVQRIVSLGFNCVRLPFSLQLLYEDPVVPEIALAANAGLKGIRAMALFDLSIKRMTDAGLMVVLNNHNSAAGWCCAGSSEEGMWHTSKYPTKAWLEGIARMGARYRSNALVVAFDIRNEIHDVGEIKLTWGTSDDETRDWRVASTKGAQVLQEVSPHVLVIITGFCYGSELRAMRRAPPELKLPNKLVYTSHTYDYALWWNILKNQSPLKFPGRGRVAWRWLASKVTAAGIALAVFALVNFVLSAWMYHKSVQGFQDKEHVQIGIYRGAMRCLSACICREVRCKVWRERVP
jgi:hypothetical protein